MWVLEKFTGALQVKIGKDVEIVDAGGEAGGSGGQNAGLTDDRHDGGGCVAEGVLGNAENGTQACGVRLFGQVADKRAEGIGDGGGFRATDDLDDFTLE